MMKHIAAYAATALVAATLTLGMGAGPASADGEPVEPCADRQAQVTKAEEALDRVTAVFEKQQAKVTKAKKELVRADKAVEKSKAAKGLEKAKAKKVKAKKAKKAQLNRLAKAQQRLADCLAAQEPVDPPIEG